MSTINPFPSQAPFVDPQTGRLTREGLRFVNDLFGRAGGTYGLSTTDVDAGSFAAMQPATSDGCLPDVLQCGSAAYVVSPEPMQSTSFDMQASDVMQADMTQPVQFWSP